jgi:HK97 family phage portal protein
VLEEGMKFEKLSLTNEEAQFLETRKFQRSEICAIFRVPPHKVMDLDRATYSNMEVSEQAYINDALLPDADQIAEEMAAKLLFDDERDELVFGWQWDALLRADRKTRYEAHSIGLNNGFLSVNEVRMEEGRDRIEGGDQYRVPLNIGSASSPDLAPSNTPGDMAPNPVPEPAELAA